MEFKSKGSKAYWNDPKSHFRDIWLFYIEIDGRFEKQGIDFLLSSSDFFQAFRFLLQVLAAWSMLDYDTLRLLFSDEFSLYRLPEWYFTKFTAISAWLVLVSYLRINKKIF